MQIKSSLHGSATIVFDQWDLCSWDHETKENFYIMGYNLNNTRRRQSAPKIPQWPSLRPLALKGRFIRQFEFSENLEDLYGKCCWRARPCSGTTFPYKSSYSFKTPDCHKIAFFDDGDHLAVLIFSTCFLRF